MSSIYTEYKFPKERIFWKRNIIGGGDLRTIVSAHARVAFNKVHKNTYSAYSQLFRVKSIVNRILFISKTE